MDFLGDLPADAREVLSGREWKPQSVSEFTSRWEQDAPELAQQARELEALLNKTERESPVKFAKSEAYLRDVAVQVLSIWPIFLTPPSCRGFCSSLLLFLPDYS
jgi:hypothetical protein